MGNIPTVLRMKININHTRWLSLPAFQSAIAFHTASQHTSIIINIIPNVVKASVSIFTIPPYYNLSFQLYLNLLFGMFNKLKLQKTNQIFLF